MMRLSPLLLSSLLLLPRSVASGGSVGGGANARSSGRGRADARRVRRLDEGEGVVFDLARQWVKFEGCRANRFRAEEAGAHEVEVEDEGEEEEEDEEDPWTSWVAEQEPATGGATSAATSANSAPAGGGGGRGRRGLEQDEPPSRGTVAFRLCDVDRGTKGDACDDVCVSDHGSAEIDLESYLRYMVEWLHKWQGVYCEECYECTDFGTFNDDDDDDDEIPCHRIDAATCFDECQKIQNMEENGYVDAAEFVECTPLDAPTGEELYAAAVCDESSWKIDIGVFADEGCAVRDETKDVEDYLDGFKLSHALLKKTYEESECAADCADDYGPLVCENLWYASSLGHWDHGSHPQQPVSYTPAPTSPPCIYQNSTTGTWFAGLDCEHEATSVCEDQSADGVVIPDFCTNDGTCLPRDVAEPGWFCHCPPGFWGERCELAEYWGEEDEEEPWGGGWDHGPDHDGGEWAAAAAADDDVDICPRANCTAANGGMEAYLSLVELECMFDCTSSKCRDNYLLLWGVHKLCDRDALPAAVEEGLHGMEEACWMHECNHDHHQEAWDHGPDHDHDGGESWGWADDDDVDICPRVNCTAADGGMEAYLFLLELDCMVDCTSSECRESFFMFRGVYELCDHDVLPAAGEEGLHDMMEACWMHECHHDDHQEAWDHGHDFDHDGEESWGWAAGEMPDCPQVDCAAADRGMQAYLSLLDLDCMVDCTLSKCRDNFFLLREVHNLCDRGALPAAAEEGLYDAEEACWMHACSRVHQGGHAGWDEVEGAPDCDVTSCDPNGGMDAFSALLEMECMADCTLSKCGGYFLRLRGAIDLCDPDMLPEELEDGFHDLIGACGMHTCNYGWQGGWVHDHTESSSTVTEVVVVEENDQDWHDELWADKDVLLNYTARDRRALEIFYRIGQGYGWTRSEGWTSGQSVCEWHGVACDEGLSVTKLELRGNSVSAPIWDLYGAALRQLPNLTHLDLSDNQISGTFPYEFGTHLPRLEGIWLGNNQIAGSVPDSISRLSKLQTLELQENYFSWIMMNNGYTSLERLDLSDNQLSGTVQYDLARLPTLKYISLRGNSFSGGLARDYSPLTDLTVFDISQNKITGFLPYNGFAANSELRRLNLSKNYLRGTINGDILDNAMESNDGVYELDLSFNQLQGTVPNFDVDMLSINVAGNMLTGIDPMACDHELWNDGAVGAYLCDGILCRGGTANSVGRQTSADNPCVQCSETSYYGAIGCFEEGEESYVDDVDYIGPGDFVGDDASDDELDCPLYCQNGGACRVKFSQFGTDYSCSCPSGYTGELCESIPLYRPTPPPSTPDSLMRPTPPPDLSITAEEEEQSAVVVPLDSSSAQPSISLSTSPSMTPSAAPTEMSTISQEPTETVTDPEPEFLSSSGQQLSLHWLFLTIAIFFSGVAI